MRIKAALYNADHLEYGLVTIPFPIPQDQYNDTIKMLEALDIGDPRAKDCMVEEIEGCVPSLKCWRGTESMWTSWITSSSGWTVFLTGSWPSSKEWQRKWDSPI